jgi:hypothetical protein
VGLEVETPLLDGRLARFVNFDNAAARHRRGSARPPHGPFAPGDESAGRSQLAPHRRIDMRPDEDPEHFDFVAPSAHKMYAPFGCGALIGPREVFLHGEPEYRGGGTIEVSRPTTCSGPVRPIVTRPAARTSSARWRWRSRSAR